MARKSISPRLPKGLLGFSCRVWYNLSCQLIVVRLDKKPSRCIYLQKRALQMTITLQLILFAFNIPVPFILDATTILCIYGWGLSKYQVGIILGLCKRDYRIVFSIMTVSVSDTPSILRISSIHLLMSVIAGAAIIAAISYWPVIS